MKISEKQKRELNNSIRLNMDLKDEELFGSREKKRYSIRQEKKRVILLGTALAVLFVLAVLLTNDLLLGFNGFTTIVKQLIQRTNDIVDLILGNRLSTGIHFHIIMFAAPVLVGMALGSAGACYQGVFHNPVASPTMLGITSGGMVGSAIYMIFFPQLQVTTASYGSYSSAEVTIRQYSIWQLYSKQLFIMAGCFLVVVILLIVAKAAGHGKLSVSGLMIGGSVFATTISSALSFAAYILTLTGQYSIAEGIRGQLAGQFDTISSPRTLLVMAIPLVIPMIFLMILSNKMNLVAFGEDEAKAMGINVDRTRILIIVLTTIMTATTVAFCGQVSFVGLLVPQLARFISGNDYRYLLPASAFLGGITMLAAFIIFYSLNFFLGVGAYVNVIGGILFLIMMIRYRRSGHADWT